MSWLLWDQSRLKETKKCCVHPFVSQLAGVVAVEVTGGPTIDFVAGRKVSLLQRHDTILGLILFQLQGNDMSLNQQNGCRKFSKLLVAYEGFSVIKDCYVASCFSLQDSLASPPEGRLPNATKGMPLSFFLVVLLILLP